MFRSQSSLGSSNMIIAASLLLMMFPNRGTAPTSDPGARARIDSLASDTAGERAFFSADDADNLIEDIRAEEGEVETLDPLLWLMENPYDLNSVSAEQLEALPRVTPDEARAIVGLRKNVGRFTSVEQLRVMDDDSQALVGKVAPYVTIRRSSRTSHESDVASVRLRLRGSSLVGHAVSPEDGPTLGSPLRAYQRLTIGMTPGIELGGLYAKDQGERFSDGFASAYVMVHDVGFFPRIIAGDFVVESGQGLVFWGSSSASKWDMSGGNARRSALGIRPFRSTSESGFMRGLAVAIGPGFPRGGLNVQLFLSRRPLSANVDESGSVSGIYESGLYRNERELAKRNAVHEEVIGGRASLTVSEEWTIGTTFSRSSFDRAVPEAGGLAQPSAATHVTGIDFVGRLGRLDVFGEGAVSSGNALAMSGGVLVSLAPASVINISYRDLAERFSSRRAGPSGESGRSSNERGLCVGWDLAVNRSLSFHGYYDQFRFPWRTYLNPVPSSGSDFMAQAAVAIADGLNIRVRFIERQLESSEPAFDGFQREIRSVVERDQMRIGLLAALRISTHCTVRERIEATEVGYDLREGSETGMLLSHEIRFEPVKWLNLEARLASFDTRSYDSRLYDFENDVPGAFACPALYGRGRRWHVLAEIRVAPSSLIAIKYSATEKQGGGVSPAGILGPAPPDDRRISMQLDLRLL